MGYEVYCRGEHAYFVPTVKTQSDGRRQPEIEAEKLRKEIQSNGFTFIEADTQIKLTCFATGEDGLEPTAEWSRIQQALKERDELAAELERVKAERDDARQSADTQCQIRYMVDEELSSLKSRLPVNADGDVVLWGDLQEYTYGQVARVEIIEKCPHPVNGIRDRWRFEFDNEDYDYADNCHSTAESCRAANAQEGE